MIRSVYRKSLCIVSDFFFIEPDFQTWSLVLYSVSQSSHRVSLLLDGINMYVNTTGVVSKHHMYHFVAEGETCFFLKSHPVS